MLSRGFEWTLRYGEPTNRNPKRYRQQPPCCSLQQSAKGVLACGAGWEDSPELPEGDPLNGGPWKRSWPDAGTYEGGTYVDAPFREQEEQG